MAISRQNALIGWVGLLAAGGASMCVALVLSGYRVGHPVAIAVLAALAVVAERQSIRLTQSVEVSVASLLYIFAAVLFGPLSAMVVSAASLLVEFPRRGGGQPILRWLSWTAIRVLIAGSAGLVAVAVARATAGGFWGIFAAVTAAYAAEAAVDVTLSPVAAAIRRTGPWVETVTTVAQSLLASAPLQAPIVAVLAYSYSTVSPWSVALFAIPAVAAQRLHLLYRQQRETSQALGAANARLERANLSFATALVATLDARDRYTAGHSAAVAIYARDIAERLGCKRREQELAHLCGLVHDVGKIGLHAGLLEKPGALSLDERRQMEKHSVIGERILRNVDDYVEIASVVRHHHERFDGLGYPDGLGGEDIPLLSRIIAVADAYNAMTSDRPYRDAMPSRVARLRLAQGVEGQFDTTVVAAFEAILAGSDEDYRTGRGPKFVLQAFEPSEAQSVEPQPIDFPAVAAAIT